MRNFIASTTIHCCVLRWCEKGERTKLCRLDDGDVDCQGCQLALTTHYFHRKNLRYSIMIEIDEQLRYSSELRGLMQCAMNTDDVWCWVDCNTQICWLGYVVDKAWPILTSLISRYGTSNRSRDTKLWYSQSCLTLLGMWLVYISTLQYLFNYNRFTVQSISLFGTPVSRGAVVLREHSVITVSLFKRFPNSVQPRSISHDYSYKNMVVIWRC